MKQQEQQDPENTRETSQNRNEDLSNVAKLGDQKKRT
jgi:hypothetical protein